MKEIILRIKCPLIRLYDIRKKAFKYSSILFFKGEKWFKRSVSLWHSFMKERIVKIKCPLIRLYDIRQKALIQGTKCSILRKKKKKRQQRNSSLYVTLNLIKFCIIRHITSCKNNINWKPKKTTPVSTPNKLIPPC